jgi:hypothetical protein
MEPTVAAYLAGLFDGEGCFRLERFATDRSPIGFQYRVIVEITMCDFETISFVAAQTDRKRIEHKTLPSGRIAFKLVWRNSLATALLQELLPYLHGKQEQAELCLHFEDRIAPGRGHTYRQEDKIRCEEVRQRLSDLKKPIALRC